MVPAEGLDRQARVFPELKQGRKLGRGQFAGFDGSAPGERPQRPFSGPRTVLGCGGSTLWPLGLQPAPEWITFGIGVTKILDTAHMCSILIPVKDSTEIWVGGTAEPLSGAGWKGETSNAVSAHGEYLAVKELCFECGFQMAHQGGCAHCPLCGWSRCSC